MLVLSRNPQQSLEFPDLAVVIRVLRCTPAHAQIGIDAPHAIRVLRGELSPNELRSLPFGEPASEGLGLVEKLESQIAALTEMSTAADRPLACSVAEDASETMQRLRRLLLVAGRRPAPPSTAKSTSTPSADDQASLGQPSCVRQASADYAVDALAASA